MKTKAKTVKIVFSVVALLAAATILYIQFAPASEPPAPPTSPSGTKTASAEDPKTGKKPGPQRKSEDTVEYSRQGGGILAPGGDK